MSANVKSTSTVEGVKQPGQNINYTIGDNVDDLKLMDYGVNALAGFASNSGFQVSAGYGYGFTNVLPEQNDVKIKNRIFNISLGYSL
ncbi:MULTISPECIES: hypothetical protein [unclassified Mucilaginibacter]|uniref:hypothetical protein n=1 Tax=unclassified Mucilaginibacter TaxID=2617802 RepID=UPI002AC8EB75|nr:MULTISPECIES: hypothetical protein [unclassified Mucilaginibacter]MEB0260334.1 hypothetical protein [Mucilaginibacter sp. 10I4]MEB0279373.1 hypothetical protein [Mucilaginibacter sp. 10B2]MEB0300500.1 hypothetical protein [Mucilaginibacter sp. 5C4]WPX21746.1 hypothetical protein RHM67_10660 [Mucilaginibacter sp. 5C4]